MKNKTMKHLYSYLMIMLIAGVLFISCRKENSIDTTIPECMLTIIDDPHQSTTLRTIQTKIYNDVAIYWMNTDVNIADGVEYILSSQCDTLGTYCTYCINQPYGKGEWSEIWSRP